MTSKPNGVVQTKATITLTYDLLTGNMTIGGDSPNINISLAMLAQATREFEALERIGRIQQAQAQMREQAETQRIAESIRGKV